MTSSALRPHSLIGQSAWIDLLRMLKEDAVSDLRGKPTLKHLNKRNYWYDRYRIGTQLVERYIGEDTPSLRADLERAEQLRQDSKARARETARLVRLLKSEGYLAPDLGTGQILSALARSGVFRLGGTVVGTYAFRQYEGVLGVRISAAQIAETQDIDIASFERLSLALGDHVDPDLASVFAELKFEPLMTTDRRRAWRWRQTESRTLVEFLTPSFGNEEGLRDLPALGVTAQSLHFLNFLIAEPTTVPLLYRSGVLIQIPRPERYAIHKLIVADRRIPGAEAGKARKDRAQAALLIGVLAEEQPDLLAEAYQTALGNGPSWRNAIEATLARLPDTKALLDTLPA